MTTPATPAINPEYPINALVMALWDDAVRLAVKGDPDARRWLYDEGVLMIDIIKDIHPDHTRRYLDRLFRQRRKAHRKPQDERKRPRTTRTTRTLQPAA